MSPPSHQTVRIARGRHIGPRHGACVMELASMLAGEPFSDHPRCASPVVGEFLRTYNDLIDNDRRQTLYRYAAGAVGSRAPRPIEAARVAACEEWIRTVMAEPDRSRWRRWRLRCALDHSANLDVVAASARLGAMLARQDGDVGHARVLVLLDSLLAMGTSNTTAPVSVDLRSWSRRHACGA